MVPFIILTLPPLFSVPPQFIAIKTNPSPLFEGHKSVVDCNVGQVKPLANLDIQLLNGTSQLEGGKLEHIVNEDGVTVSAMMQYDVIFSR